MASETDWDVLPHGDLVQLAENLWWVDGDLPSMDLRRSMVVARTSTGELVLHSAIAMDEEHMAQLEALGRPAWLIVPNGWHRLDVARYKARYPDLQVVCPKRAVDYVRAKVEPIAGSYDDFPSLDPEGTVRLEHFDADRHVEGAMIVRSDDGVSLVFADSLFNLPHKPGLWWWFYGRVLGNTGGPRVTGISRLMMFGTRSRPGYRAFLQRQAESGEVVRLVPGHGAVVDHDAQSVLEEIVASL